MASGRRWTFLHSYLAGITRDRWRALMRENRVDPGYRHRAAYLGCMSLVNSLYGRREQRLHGAAIARARVEQAPIFILGHWRSGTTHLHNLLARDERLACPNGLQVCWPHTFLTAEPLFLKRAGLFGPPPTRPMDNVAISMATPQEDEFALCAASLRSPYLGLFSFPRRAGHYDRYLTLRDVPPAEREEWKETLHWFLRKLTYRWGRRLLLKSPTHTARVALLLELFPDARFVHIRRDPYAVFQSTEHLFRRLPPKDYLQRPPEDPREGIFRRYTRMYDAYFAERERIPAGRLHELSFEALERDPVGEVRLVYERLGLEGFGALEPGLRAYAASLAGYRKNAFDPLPSELRRRVAAEWRRSFDAWGYPA